MSVIREGLESERRPPTRNFDESLQCWLDRLDERLVEDGRARGDRPEITGGVMPDVWSPLSGSLEMSPCPPEAMRVSDSESASLKLERELVSHMRALVQVVRVLASELSTVQRDVDRLQGIVVKLGRVLTTRRSASRSRRG